MTVYGWDASHFDGTLTPAILARAADEGIAFFTHKLGEGLADTEGGHDDTALAAARTAGIPLLGGYLVPRSAPTVAAQVDFWIGLADAGEPWWRQHPGWFWQIDLERWPYDPVPASVGIAAARLLQKRTGRWTVLYASHGQYSDQLTAWDGPIWNADYAPRPAGAPAAMYPGDGWMPAHGGWLGGWAPYSGREPTLLQFTSSATIAGLSTCDANAFRGSLAELRALIEGGTTMPTPLITSGTPSLEQTQDDLWNGWVHGHSGFTNKDGSHDVHFVNAQLNRIEAAIAALSVPAPVALTDAQLSAFAADVAAQLGAKLDLLIAAVKAAGQAVTGS
jgi:hypothetical protein